MPPLHIYCNSNLRYINVAYNVQPPAVSYTWEAVINLSASEGKRTRFVGSAALQYSVIWQIVLNW